MKKSKGYMRGGKTKGMAVGGKLPMVEKDGKQGAFFAADVKGKMANGGRVPKTKGYFKGGKTASTRGDDSITPGFSARAQMRRKKKAAEKGAKKMSKGGVARGSGAARPQMFRKDG